VHYPEFTCGTTFGIKSLSILGYIDILSIATWVHAEVHAVESMLNVVMLSAVITECHFCIVMLNVILLSVGMMNVMMLSVMGPN
jgi:hypothetical protein